MQIFELYWNLKISNHENQNLSEIDVCMYIYAYSVYYQVEQVPFFGTAIAHLHFSMLLKTMLRENLKNVRFSPKAK